MDLEIDIDTPWPGAPDWADLAFQAAESAASVAPELANQRLTASLLLLLVVDQSRFLQLVVDL